MRRRLASVLLCSVTLVGVAEGQEPQRLPATTTTTGEMASAVTVQNHRSVPVTVYIEFGQFDRRLGTVDANANKSLALPRWALAGHSSVRLYVHPEGALKNLGTQQLSLKAPTHLALIVPATGDMPNAAKEAMMESIPEDALADATLTVDNPRDVPVTIFAQQQQFDVRLGVVPANGKATLRFPKSVIDAGSSLRLVVHPEGGRDLASTSMKVATGQHLGLKVPMP